MQEVLIIPKTEFETLVARIAKLEELTQPQAAPRPDQVLKVAQAADYLSLTPGGIRKARRQKRLVGFKINEKEWGFHRSELERYKYRHSRNHLSV